LNADQVLEEAIIRFYERLTMRTTFTVEVVCDIDHRKPQDLEAFKELMREEWKVMYPLLAVMSSTSPEMRCTVYNLDIGVQTVELFTPESNEDDNIVEEAKITYEASK